MPCPSELGLLEQAVDAGESGMLKNLCIWNSILPPNMYQMKHTGSMKMLECLGMAGVHAPGLACIQKSQYDGPAHFQFGLQADASVLPKSGTHPTESCAGLGDLTGQLITGMDVSG